MKYPFATMIMLGLLGGMITPAHAVNRSVESALANYSDVSLFYQALRNTGVAGELDENTEYTIFAPTNAAFAEIQPRDYPCFYSSQCRAEVAAVLRNHIVPRNETIHDLSLWGGNSIPTIGKRGLYVEETYKGQYTVEGHSVLNTEGGEKVSVFRIDGVIIGDRELSRFRTRPVATAPGTVTEKTVTTYRTQGVPTAVSGGYPVPGGYGASTVYTAPGEQPDNTVETTTVTHTTTTHTGE